MEDGFIVEMEIAAPPERVFRALTDPRELKAWWEADGRLVSWEMDLRVGGQWRSVGKDDTCGEYEIKGQVVELDPPRTLAYTWEEILATPGDPKRVLAATTLVRYDLERCAKGTRVRVSHTGFAGNLKALEDYRGGWPGVLGRLRVYEESQAA